MKIADIHPFFRRLFGSIIFSGALLSLVIVAFLALANEITVLSDRYILTNSNILWGPGFAQQTRTYKLKRALYLKPDVMFLGSSRVTQFRDIMAPGIKFFNAGLGATSLLGAEAFLRTLYRDHKPKFVLLGVDPWWLRPEETVEAPESSLLSFNIGEFLSASVSNIMRTKILASLFSGELEIRTDVLGVRRPVGYLAALSASGFRPDGSYQYGDILLGKNELFNHAGMGQKNGFKFYTKAVKNNSNRFWFTGKPDRKKLEILRRILLLNKSNGVETILFLAPFAQAVYDAIQQSPTQRPYFLKFNSAVKKVAEDNSVSFFNLNNLSELGLTDDHSLDGLHVDEIASLAVVRRLVSGDKKLRKLYGENGIKTLERLAKNKNDWAGQHRIIP